MYACQQDTPSLSQEDLIEKEEENSQKQLSGDIPEFIGNSFEFGIYSEKIMIPNADNVEYAAINEGNRIELPECNVLSILLDTLYNDIVLYEGTFQEIKDFFGEIQKLEFQKEKEYVATLSLNADCVFEADCIMANLKSKNVNKGN